MKKPILADLEAREFIDAALEDLSDIPDYIWWAKIFTS